MIGNKDAQFMLLAGFIIAIGLVITTVMLNNIIFEGSVAGEVASDPLRYDIVNMVQVTRDEMKSAYRNANGTNNTLKIANFSKEMQNFSSNLSKIYALRGEGVKVSWDANNWNNLRYANFTDNGTSSGATNWTVIQNVSSSNITVNVTSVSGTFQIGLINISNSSWINITFPTTTPFTLRNATATDPYSIVFRSGNIASGNYSINGIASGRSFTRARDYILNATVTLSTSRVRANITIPVSVPW